MKNFFQSSSSTKLIVILAGLLAALGIFWLGTIVGSREAEYSSRWAGHYAEAFGSPRGPFGFRTSGGPGGMGMGMMSSNGAVGTVMAINLPTVAVTGPDEAEKVIVLGPNTIIRKLRAPATTTDIHMGDFLISIGSPDEEGRIAATFVRIMPPMPSSTVMFQGRAGTPASR